MLALSTIDYLTAALVIITGIYAWLTYKIARANSLMLTQVQRQVEAQSRPVVSVNVETRHQTVLSLRISNRGFSPAERLRIAIDRRFFQFAEKSVKRDISQFHLFTSEIPVLAAGDGFLVDLAQGFNFNKIVDGENITPDQFHLTASYRFGDKIYSEDFSIDLRPYFQSHGRTTVVEQLEHIRKALEKMVP